MSLKDKVAIVTGASSGIGAAIVVIFAKEGAHVVMIARNVAKLKNVETRVQKAGLKPLVVIADLTNDADVERVMKSTIDVYGKLDILINNAGACHNASLLEGGIMKSYDSLMAINLRSVVCLTSLAAPHLVKSKGNIINISSIAGKRIIAPDAIVYCMTKAAVDHFTRGVAYELSPKGVRVNTISPGPVKTDLIENAVNMKKATFEEWADKLPLGRVGESEEIADLALFLVSHKARSITGADFISDNGCLAV